MSKVHSKEALVLRRLLLPSLVPFPMGIEQVVLMIDAPCIGGFAIIFGPNLVY
jgi:hypothetical protein